MRHNFAVLLTTSFLSDIVSPIFALYLPLFAYELGASVLEVGLVGGVAYASYSFMPFVIGRYSDRIKRRKDFLTASLAILAVCSVVYVFVDSPIQLIVLRVLEGIAWATVWPMIDVEVSQDIHGESSRSFSIYNTVWAVASALGPLVATALIVLLSQIRYVFAVTAILMLAATFVNAGLMRSDKATPAPTPVPETGRPARVTGKRLTNSIWAMVVVMVFVSAVRGVLFTFYPPLAESRGASYLIVGVVGFSFGAARACAFAVTTRDAFRRFFLDEKKMMTALAVSMAVCAVAGLFPILGADTLLLGLLAFVVAALANSLAMMICQVELIARSDFDKRGGAAGIFESSIGIGAALGPALSGFVSGGSLSTPFLIVPIGFFVALSAMLGLNRRGNHRPTIGSRGEASSVQD